MTERFLSLGALLLLVAVTVGCFNSATMQQMQEASQAYSMSPSFKLDRNWRIAILPPHNGDDEVPGLYDHAGLLLMKPGCFTLIDRAEVELILREQRSGGPRLVDPHDMRRLGRLMNAAAVMTISVTELKHDDFFKDNPEQRDARLFVKIISVKTAEALYYAEGRGTSFEGADAALDDALAMTLGPLIRVARG
jgi:curli biogenesis system outer membrane secretion channel CsgG